MNTFKSKLIETILIILWIAFWGFLCNFLFTKFETLTYKKVTITPHQNITWNNGDNIILHLGTSVTVRTIDRNFTILDENKDFVCTGKAVEMQPSDNGQPFECDLFSNENNKIFTTDTYATIYVTTPTTIEKEVETQVWQMLLVSITGAIFIVSILTWLGSLVTGSKLW